MNEVVQSKAKRFGIIVVVSLVAASFAIAGVGSVVINDGTVLAKVNGKKVMRRDVEMQSERFLRSQSSSDLADIDRNQIKTQALGGIIQTKALASDSTQNGFRISKVQYGRWLEQIPAFQIDGRFSKVQFVQFLRNSYHSPDSFKISVEEDLLISQMQSGLTESSFSLPSDVKTAIALVEQQRDYRYSILKRDSFLNQVSLEEAAAENHYNRFSDNYMTDELVSIEYIRLDPKELTKDIGVSDKELQAHYEATIARYTDQERRKAAHILIASEDENAAKEKIDMIKEKLNQGGKFADLAKEYSDDVISAKEGGDLDWILAEEVEADFAKELFALKKGATSEPFKTQFGYHIVSLQDIEAKSIQPLDKVRAEVKAELLQDKVESLISDRGNELANLVYENPETLQVAADRLNLDVQTTELFSRDATSRIIEPQTIEAAFSDEVIHQRLNSDVLELSDRSYIVLRNKEHTPSELKPFEDVKQGIAAKLLTEKASIQAFTNSKEYLAKFKQGESIDKWLSEHKGEWKTVEKGKRSDNFNYPIVHAAFSLSEGELTEAHKASDVVALADGNVAVIELISVEDGELEQIDAKTRELYQEQLAKSIGNLEYQLYRQKVMQTAKIKYISQI